MQKLPLRWFKNTLRNSIAVDFNHLFSSLYFHQSSIDAIRTKSDEVTSFFFIIICQVSPGEYRLSALAVTPDSAPGLLFSPSYADVMVKSPLLDVQFTQVTWNVIWERNYVYLVMTELCLPSDDLLQLYCYCVQMTYCNFIVIVSIRSQKFNSKSMMCLVSSHHCFTHVVVRLDTGTGFSSIITWFEIAINLFLSIRGEMLYLVYAFVFFLLDHGNWHGWTTSDF